MFKTDEKTKTRIIYQTWLLILFMWGTASFAQSQEEDPLLEQGGFKAALLLGVGTHQAEVIARNLATMQRVLKKEAGFHQITVLEDESASLSAMEQALTTGLLPRFKGKGNQLLI